MTPLTEHDSSEVTVRSLSFTHTYIYISDKKNNNKNKRNTLTRMCWQVGWAVRQLPWRESGLPHILQSKQL